MKLVRAKSSGENNISLILLENTDEQIRWSDIAPSFAEHGMIITDICLTSRNGEKMGILKIIHRNGPHSLLRFLESKINNKNSDFKLKLTEMQPQSKNQDTHAFYALISNHCSHLEFVKSSFVLIGYASTRDEWLIIPKNHNSTYKVEFLDERGLFIEELVHRIRRTIHLEQLSYNACKNLPSVTEFQLPQEKNNLFSIVYPRSILDLDSLFQILVKYHENLASYIDFNELFLELGKMQFYCYWLGHYNLKESVVIRLNPLKGVFTQLKSFYSPLSNAILLNTYHSIDSILNSEQGHPLTTMDELWEKFREGMHVEAIRLQQLLENEETKKELIFLLKAYQRLLRFSSNDLERMFTPSMWFKVF